MARKIRLVYPARRELSHANLALESDGFGGAWFRGGGRHDRVDVDGRGPAGGVGQHRFGESGRALLVRDDVHRGHEPIVERSKKMRSLTPYAP